MPSHEHSRQWRGIKAGDLTHIFDIFFQGEVSGGVQHGGLGVGLPVVKNLVELHAATIEVHSDGGRRNGVHSADSGRR
jgi:signal transduction histidine kinase